MGDLPNIQVCAVPTLFTIILIIFCTPMAMCFLTLILNNIITNIDTPHYNISSQCLLLHQAFPPCLKMCWEPPAQIVTYQALITCTSHVAPTPPHYPYLIFCQCQWPNNLPDVHFQSRGLRSVHWS